MQSLTLSRDELIELTAYKRPADQARWLKAQGIPYYIAADGHPRIIRAVLVQSTNEHNHEPQLRLA
jgi:hypothetical protein